MGNKIENVAVSSFALGMNTRLPDFKLSAGDAGHYMREILNCDISEDGALSLRRGYTKVLSAAVGGSLWADDAQAYYASAGSLMSLADVAGTLVQTSVAGASLSSGAPVSFCSAPMGGAYWTDGVSLGYVAGGVSIPVAPPTPIALPAVSAIAGTLDAGIYTYCFTYTDAAGRESGATAPVSITLAALSGLSFVLGGTPGYTLHVYVSSPNGQTMYHRAQIATAGTMSVTTLTHGRECITVGLINLPAGRFVRFNNGRLMVAVGSLLCYSRPFMSGLFDPTKDFIPFPAPITVLECVSNQGSFVVADQTYWLAGDIAEAPLAAPLQFGAVMGSGTTRPDISGCFWMSTRGIVVGNDGGSVTELQADKVMVTLTASGASLMMDRDGTVQLLTSLYGAVQTPDSEGSKYTSAEVTDTAGTGEAWVVAEVAKSSRRYLNYAFTGYAEIAGRYYGVKADGVYLLEGATDAGTAINASINPGRQDYSVPTRKRQETAYLHFGSSAGSIAFATGVMHLTITDDQGNAYTYDTDRNASQIQVQRIKVGRGLTGTYLSYRITNDLGSPFELVGFELMAVEMKRRVRGK